MSLQKENYIYSYITVYRTLFITLAHLLANILQNDQDIYAYTQYKWGSEVNFTQGHADNKDN